MNSVDPDEIPCFLAFHLSLRCLQKDPFMGEGFHLETSKGSVCKGLKRGLVALAIMCM